MNNTQKILLSVATIGIVGALTVGATSAFFSDTANTVSNNSITVGDMELKLHKEGGASGWHDTIDPFWDLSGLEPGGDEEVNTLRLKNDGSVDGTHQSFDLSLQNPNEGNPTDKAFAKRVRITKLAFEGNSDSDDIADNDLLEGGAGRNFDGYNVPAADHVVGSTQELKDLVSADNSPTNASDGDVIVVEDGSYTSWIPVDVPNVTLVSKNPRGAEIGRFTVRASGVTIQGFEVTGDGADYNGISVEPDNGADSGVVIKDNYIHGIAHTSNDSGKEESFGVLAWGSNTSLKDITIKNNLIEEIGDASGSGQGFGIFAEELTNSGNGAVIANNTVRNIHGGTDTGDNYPGVGVALLPELTNPDNSVSGTGKIVSGNANADVLDNHFENNAVDISVAGGASPLTISRNNFSGNTGVLTQGNVPDEGTIGIANLSAGAQSVISNGPADATNNWWTDYTPDAGEEYVGSVDTGNAAGGPFIGLIAGQDTNGNGFADLHDFANLGLSEVTPGIATGNDRAFTIGLQVDGPTTGDSFQGKSLETEMEVTMEQVPEGN